MNKILRISIATIICLNMNILFASGISSYIGNEKALDDVNYKIALNRAILLAEQDVYQVAVVKQSKEVVKKESETAVKKEENKVKYITRGLPRTSDGSFKSYMDFRTITSKTSAQYKLQQQCKTDKLGFRRMGEYYTVAMGSFYSRKVGQKFIITFDTGKSIKVMIGDLKQDKHTNNTHQHVKVANKNIVEFIVNQNKISSLAKRMGDISWTEGNLFKGKIIKIQEIVE